MRGISMCNFKVTITFVSLSLARMWVLPFIKFEDSLADVSMFIFIFGAMEPLIGSVKKEFGRLRKLRDGRRLCLRGRKDRLLALRGRKFMLLLILFKDPWFSSPNL
jgi:hypothetical protein